MISRSFLVKRRIESYSFRETLLTITSLRFSSTTLSSSATLHLLLTSLYSSLLLTIMTKKILIVVTSAKATPWGKDTGYFLEELATPYYLFLDAGFEVEIATIT